MNKAKIKIGIIMASHKREPSSFSLDIVKKGIRKLQSRNIEIYFNQKPLTCDVEIRTEIIDLKSKDVDTYILIPGNWMEPPILCHPLEEIRNENILLWGFPESIKLIDEGHFLGSASAFLVLKNGMSQMGFEFKSILGFPDNNTIDEISNFVHAGSAQKLMRRTKIGLIGYLSMGIYTACFDQLKIRKVFGIEIDCSADSFILYKKMQDISKEEIKKIKSNLENTCSTDKAVLEDGSLETSVRMYLALKKMVKEGGWKGISVKCQHELSTYLKCTACLPLSMLTDEKIMCTDEGDIHALLTMLIMYNLSEEDSAIYFGDIYKLTEGGHIMTHCGLSPHNCRKGGTKVGLLPQNKRISKDGENTGGVISSYFFKDGFGTMGRIENDRDGNYIFHFCNGKVTPSKSIGSGMSTMIFMPEGSSEMFTQNQLANHYIFVYEDIKEKIQEFCRISGIKIIDNK